jgi:hypothetical protein
MIPQISRNGRRLVAAACLAALVGLWNLARADGPRDEVPGDDAAPTEKLVVLRNGEVLRGVVERTETHYRIERAGGEIKVKIADVECCCVSLDDAYANKRDSIEPGELDGLLGLADWCLRQGLEDRAAACLDDARELDARHPKLAVLTRRLEMKQAPARPRAAGKGRALGVSNDELDRLVRGLPKGALESFTRSVQPILLNNCTAAGCHGPGSGNPFSLLRPPPKSGGSRRVTQRNLHATLTLVDRDKPDRSRLLTVPRRPHGTAVAAIFADKERSQYWRLVRWVRDLQTAESATEETERPIESPDSPQFPDVENASDPLAENDETPADNSDESPDEEMSAGEEFGDDRPGDGLRRKQRSASRNSAGRRKPADDVEGKPVSFDEIVDDASAEDEPPGEEASDEAPIDAGPLDENAETKDQSAARRRGKRVRAFGEFDSSSDENDPPRDPFDAEVFNRRYHRKKK